MAIIFLYQGELNPNDIRLRDPTLLDTGGGLLIEGRVIHCNLIYGKLVA